MKKTFRERYHERLPGMREVARSHGYALAVHGSEMRDFDVIAVPWVERVSLPFVLAFALCEVVEGVITKGGKPDDSPTVKPHRRLCWSIQIGGGAYIDLSVIQPDA